MYLTVGELRKALSEMPDDAPVYYERIEDVYFDNHEWKTLDISDTDGDPTMYIRAFCAHRRTGETGLFITAHY